MFPEMSSLPVICLRIKGPMKDLNNSKLILNQEGTQTYLLSMENISELSEVTHYSWQTNSFWSTTGSNKLPYTCT
jgi:hypothetical protein